MPCAYARATFHVDHFSFSPLILVLNFLAVMFCSFTKGGRS